MHVISFANRMTVFFLLLLLTVAGLATSLSSDGWALLHFRSNIEDDPHCALLNWNVYDSDPCRWFGVQCEDGKVTTIDLSGLLLKGTLAPELGQLTSLRKLILRENNLRGVIPFHLGELEKLEVLDLSGNRLSGQLPENLGNLSSLSRLYLGHNQLNGSIPAELGDINKLNELIVNANRLRGTILGVEKAQGLGNVDGNILATGLCKLKQLHSADFSSNYFEGSLPSCLHYLPRSNFMLNCLSTKELPNQRSSEDCSRVSIARRRLLQINATIQTGNVTSTSSPAFVPSPASSPAFVPTPSPSPTFVPTPAPSPAPSSTYVSGTSSENQQNSKDNWVGVASGVAVFLVVAGIVVFLCYRHKGTAVRPWKSSMSGELQKEFSKGVPAFSHTELEDACEDFSNIIGASKDIVLFKGTLANDVEVAVTSIRVSPKSWSSNSELIFWRKVECLSQMKHENIVNLVGYCAEEDPFVRMLVFEYVANGSVHEHLHNKEAEHLDWETRMRIIVGVARALDQMHHEFSPPVAHTKLDTKSIFLTEDFSAKLADFGVWKATSKQKDVIKLSGEKNSNLEHEDLELSDRAMSSVDSNIYDFGVFLLEMVSGRDPNSNDFESLVEWALDSLAVSGSMSNIIDPTLVSYNREELQAIITASYDCLQIHSSSGWITMRKISSQLSTSLSSITGPVKPKSSPLLWAELEILSQD